MKKIDSKKCLQMVYYGTHAEQDPSDRTIVEIQ